MSSCYHATFEAKTNISKEESRDGEKLSLEDIICILGPATSVIYTRILRDKTYMNEKANRSEVGEKSESKSV